MGSGDDDQSGCSVECIFCALSSSWTAGDGASEEAVLLAIQSQINATGDCAGLKCNPSKDRQSIQCAPGAGGGTCEALLDLTEAQGGWIPDEWYANLCESDSDPLADCSVEILEWVGDGYCDHDTDGYNTEECMWDGGDCCESSCESGMFDCGENGYDCQCSVEILEWIGDGYCDWSDEGYNTEGCGWDGGDCCEST